MTERPKMWGHIERHGLCSNQCGGCVRILEDGQQYGDPYRYSFPFKFIGSATVELYGIVGRAPTLSEVKAMLIAFRDAGWTCIIQRHSGAMQGMRIVTRKSYKPQTNV